MFQKIFKITSFVVIFSLVLSAPLAVFAESNPSPAPMPQPTMGTMTQPMTGQQQPMMGSQQMMGQQQPMMGSQQMMGPGGQQGSQGMFGFGSGNTCNINGVEMPGPCADQQQGSGDFRRGGQRDRGMMGPGGQGMMGGPSEEEMQKMDEQRQAQEKKMRARGMQQMKKGMKGMLTGMGQLEKMIAKLEKQGVPVPANLKEKIAKVKAAIDIIMKAEDMEDEAVQEAMQYLQEAGDELRDIGPRLGMLSQLPQMLKKAQTEISRLEKAYKKADAKLQRAGVDASGLLAKWQTVINELKDTLASVKNMNFEEGADPMQVIGEEIFQRLEEAWKFDQMVQMMLNVRRDLKHVASALKRYEKTIARFERKGEDMGEAKEILAEMKTAYEEVKNIAWDKLEPEEIEDFLGGLENYMEMQARLEEMLNLGGPSEFERDMERGRKSQGVPQFNNMPQFNQMMQNTLNLDKEVALAWSKVEGQVLNELRAEKAQKLKNLAALLQAVKFQINDLAAAGVEVSAELSQGVLGALTSLGASSAVAAR